MSIVTVILQWGLLSMPFTAPQLGWQVKIYGLSQINRQLFRQKVLPEKVVEMPRARTTVLVMQLPLVERGYSYSRKLEKEEIPLEYASEHLNVLGDIGYKVTAVNTMKVSQFDSYTTMWTLQLK